jgi:hypothetical protein
MTTTSQRSLYTSKNNESTATLSDLPAPPQSGETDSDSWYEVVNGETLEQGDVLTTVVTPRAIVDPDVEGGYRIRVGSASYIIVSQTCDLEHDKVHEVLLASVRTYQELAHEVESARRTGFREALIQGTDFAYFLLHQFAGPPHLEWSVVNFHQLRLVDISSCRTQAKELGPRLRLIPPYKESLAQSFGRYMMRVALPYTAHSFKSVKYVPPTTPRSR